MFITCQLTKTAWWTTARLEFFHNPDRWLHMHRCLQTNFKYYVCFFFLPHAVPLSDHTKKKTHLKLFRHLSIQVWYILTGMDKWTCDPAPYKASTEYTCVVLGPCHWDTGHQSSWAQSVTSSLTEGICSYQIDGFLFVWIKLARWNKE